MSGEFVLYTENHALQYIMQQPKLNRKHAKWVEYLQSFTFVIKHMWTSQQGGRCAQQEKLGDPRM